MTRTRVVGGVLYIFSLIVVSRTLHAYSTGISGWSGDPIISGGSNCNACHFGGTPPTVTITGPTDVAVGETNTYTLRISGGQMVGGGLDVAADDGMLSVADPGTQILANEITHNAPRPVDGNSEVAWSFNWTAPLNPANAKLYGSGNSVNLSGSRTGDRAASTSLAISVGGGVATPGETSGPGVAPLRVTDYNSADGDLSISFETACGTTNNNIYYGALDQISKLDYFGAWCAIGTSGSYNAFNPGSGSVFFIVVGNRGITEGSYGTYRLSGGSLNERAATAGDICGQVQDLGDRCD